MVSLIETLNAIIRECGLSKAHIDFYSSLDELLEIAEKYNLPQEEIENLSESTLGMYIQVDEDLDGGEITFFLKDTLPDETNISICKKLEDFGLNPSPDMYSMSTEKCYEFLLLHEIGHHKLGHGPNNNYDEKELSANSWALAKFDVRTSR